MQVAPAKPPYVKFEMRSVEDRNESVNQGRRVYKDVAYALVTPAGGRDTVEKLAEEWLAQMKHKAYQQSGDSSLAPDQMYAQQWHRHFSQMYDAWKSGQEIPEVGTPIRMCLMFSPSEAEAILNANIRTLEDLATIGEEGMGRIGMGGRDLKERAKRALDASSNGGALAARMETLERDNADLKAKLAEALVALAEKPKRGRPPLSEAA